MNHTDNQRAKEPVVASLSIAELERATSQLKAAMAKLRPLRKELIAASKKNPSEGIAGFFGIVAGIVVAGVVIEFGRAIETPNSVAETFLLIGLLLLVVVLIQLGYLAGVWVSRVHVRRAKIRELRASLREQLVSEILALENSAEDGFLWKFSVIATLECVSAQERERLLDALAELKGADFIGSPMEYTENLKMLLEIASAELRRLQRLEVVKEAENAGFPSNYIHSTPDGGGVL